MSNVELSTAAPFPKETTRIRGTMLLEMIQKQPHDIPGCLELIRAYADLTLSNKEGYTALSLACIHSLPDVAMAIIETKRADINATNNDRQTPLMIACAKGLIPVVSTLLANNAAINAETNNKITALHYAVNSIAADPVIDLLLNNRPPADINAVEVEGETPLFLACAKSLATTALLLLSRGANVNAGRYHLLSLPSVNTPPMAAVKVALEQKDPYPAVVQLTVYLRTNAKPLSPAVATSKGNTLVATLVTLSGRLLPIKDDDQKNIIKKEVEVFCLKLIAEGANLNIKDTMEGKGSCLSWACLHNLPTLAFAIAVCPGVNINDRTIRGNTPLMYAIAGGLTDVIKILLAKGADIRPMNIKNGHFG